MLDSTAAPPRNHYRPEEYFTYNVTNGVIRNTAGTRMLTIPDELISGIHAALDDETGAAAPIVLYNCGRWWGRRFIERHADELRRFYRKEAGEIPLGFFLQVLRHVWSLHGWGRLDLSFELEEHGFIVVHVLNAPYSDTVGNVGRPTEALMAGVLAAVVTHLAGRDLECAQTSCTSKGERQASFLVGTHARVEVVRSWAKQERSHAQIVEAVREGELS